MEAHMQKRNVLRILATGVLLLLVIPGLLFAAGKAKGHYGTFTAIEEDGTVVIDEKGYLLSSSATIQDYRGERILLKSLLPSRYVYFEYDYTRNGFMITLIKEKPH